MPEQSPTIDCGHCGTPVKRSVRTCPACHAQRGVGRIASGRVVGPEKIPKLRRLACYTPEALDHCAVLIFEPKDGTHVLTGAYGVIEQPAATSAEAAVTTFLGDAAGAFEGVTTIADYDREDIRQARKAPITGGRGVPTFAAGAGPALKANPPYDPLQNTTGVETIRREIAIYAVEGAEGRTPVVYVIGQ